MQVFLNQLGRHIQRSLAPCYLLTGSEHLLALDAQKIILTATKDKGFNETQTFYIQQESDWTVLNTIAQHQDLFAHKKVLLIKHIAGAFTALAQQLITQQVNNKHLNQIWIVVTSQLKKTEQRKKWYQSILKQGVIVPIYELKGTALQAWVKDKLKHAKINIESSKIVDQLIALTEGNLLATHQAVEKLKLLFPNEILTLEKLQKSIFDNARFNTFQLSDEILKGNTSKALRILTYLQTINHPPLLILWTVTQLIKDLILLLQQKSNGIPIAHLLQSQWPSRRPLFQAALGRLNLQSLEQSLLFCAKIDKMLKSANLQDSWKALDIVVLRFNYPKFLRNKLCVASSVQ